MPDEEEGVWVKKFEVEVCSGSFPVTAGMGAKWKEVCDGKRIYIIVSTFGEGGSKGLRVRAKAQDHSAHERD